MQRFGGVFLPVVFFLIGFASAETTTVTTLPTNSTSSVPVTTAFTTSTTPGVSGVESQTTTKLTNNEQPMVQNDAAPPAETTTLPTPTRPSVLETTKTSLVHSPTTTPPEQKNKKDGKSGTSKSSTAGYLFVGFTTILMMSFV